MLCGASAINLDAKGRISIPIRYRDKLSVSDNLSSPNKLVITVDIKLTCLLLYPIVEWRSIEAKLVKLSDTHPTERALKRLLLGYAHELELDSNNRLLLPLLLRQYANLTKQVMLVGQLNKFELWNTDIWQQQIEHDQNIIRNEPLECNERLADFSL